MNESLKKVVSFRTLLILGFLGCLVCIIPFSRDFIIGMMQTLLGRSLRDIGKWEEILIHAMAFFATLIAFWYFLWYTKTGKPIYDSIFSTSKKCYTQKGVSKYLLAIFIILFVCFFALFRANYEFADDIRRVYAGHKAWAGFSRFVDETLAVFLHTNFFINDISPLSQFWAMAILAVASYTLAYIVMEGKITKLSIIASTFIALSPFFLENISYKYDAPYMAMAVLFGIFPFLFVESIIDYAVTSFLCLILICTSYQSANGIYIVLAMYSALRMWLKKDSWKKIGIFTAVSVFVFAFALVFFKVFMMNKMAGDAMHPGTAIATSGIISTMKTNFIQYVRSIKLGFGNLWIKGFSALVIALFPIGTFLKKSERKPIYAALFSVVILVAMFSLSFGAYLVLEHPLFFLHAFLGFDVLLALVALHVVYCFDELPNVKKLSGTLIVCLFYGLAVEATIQGNFYYKQRDYENFRFTMLLNDLGNIVDPYAKNSIYIGGFTGPAGKTRMEQKNYKLMHGGDISPVLTHYMVKDWNMDFNVLSELTLDALEYFPELKKQLTDLPMIKDTYYHTIFGNENQYFVYLKSPKVD